MALGDNFGIIEVVPHANTTSNINIVRVTFHLNLVNKCEDLCFESYKNKWTILLGTWWSESSVQ
jgi:hypothetical protein